MTSITDTQMSHVTASTLEQVQNAQAAWIDSSGVEQRVAQVCDRGDGLPPMVQVNAGDGGYCVVDSDAVIDDALTMLANELGLPDPMGGDSPVDPVVEVIGDASDQLC